MYNFREWLHNKAIKYPNFDASDLAMKFVPYFESGQRIIVKTRYDETIRGYVGVTTGWKPVFLLALRSNSSGSSILLHNDDEIIGTVPNKFRH